MPRRLRPFEDGLYYHVIARGNNQSPIFAVDGGYRAFKQLLLNTKAKLPYQLHHYCLMPNHLHILIRPITGNQLPSIMHSLLLGYTRWYKTQQAFVGQLWQGRYRCLPITDERYMFECGRYIELNPVRAYIVSRPEDYVWSSYRHYALGQHDTVVDNDPYFDAFGSNDFNRQRNYREFINPNHHTEPGLNPVRS